MTYLQIPPNAVPVFMSFDLYTQADKDKNKEAVFKLQIEDDEICMRGDHYEVQEIAAGLCHVFQAEVNPNILNQSDFVGMLVLTERNQWPHAELRMHRKRFNGKMIFKVFLKVGERSMDFGAASHSNAERIMQGLVQFLGLKQNPKHRRTDEFKGKVQF